MIQEKLIAERLAKEIRKVAERARTEEDLRIGVEGSLRPILQELGIQHEPEYEKTILKGSADAVYGNVIIEYERPGKLSTQAGLKACRNQVMRYLVEEALRYGPKREEALKRLVGIGLDGTKIFFVRYAGKRTGPRISFPHLPRPQLALFEAEERKERFEIQEPYVVSAESIAIFLLYLRALDRRPLRPETLAEAFGPKGEAAKVAVNAFYQKALRSRSSKVQTLFAEWERIFGVVYGQEITKAEKDAGVLARLYGIEQSISLKPLLFAVHTYFALLMKLLAAELASLQPGSLFTSFVSDLPALSDEDLKRKLVGLEDGGLFAQLGIKNFLEGDFFGWYLAAWDQEIGGAVRALAQQLSQFEAATPTLEPDEIKDLLKKLYQYLVPRELRHDLGEYYTPDWLAERLLNQIGYDGNPEKRVLDPACGSGTFLTLCIKRAIEYADRKVLDRKELVDAILKNIVGFDLNPLAVIAARTNYLLALGTLRRLKAPIEIPIYLCDSILTPTEHVIRHGELFPEERRGYKIPTAVGDFLIPDEVIDKEKMERLAALLEECVRDDYTADEFLVRTRPALAFQRPETEQALTELYGKIVELERLGRNRIWARIIKNAFAPIFVGRFDYVVGNPPWVNWESLADEYREATKALWEKYDLFSLKGHAARLGGGKKDLAMLFAYASMDNYLKSKGKLGFLITQTVFKTKGAGDGFRRFQLGDQEPLRVTYVDDMVELQPFEGASNWTSVLVMQKGVPTKYPVSYTLWRKKKGAPIQLESSLEEVVAATTRINLEAHPVDEKEPTSPWVTSKPRVLDALKKALGRSSYQARAGVCTWADGIYWLRILEKRPDGLLVVENCAEAGKREIRKVQAVIEPTLIYPFIEWKDIARFKAKRSFYILMVQDPEKRVGYDEKWLKRELPHTYAYLKQFEDILKARSGYKKYFDPKTDPFYSMYNVGTYSFAPYKTVWKRMGTSIEAVVTSKITDRFIGSKPPLHKETTIFIPSEVKDEAHYLCAVLNSLIVNFVAKSYSVKGGKAFGSANLLEYVRIPQFDPTNTEHEVLSQLSQQAHELAAIQEEEADELQAVQEEIDQHAAKLWGITKSELHEIQRSLQELS